jgi:hypothetical protein
MAHVTVHQLRSKYPGSACVNVDENDGNIELWGECWSHPVYLCQMGGATFTLVFFDNQAFADEWIEENKTNFVSIMRIEPK